MFYIYDLKKTPALLVPKESDGVN